MSGCDIDLEAKNYVFNWCTDPKKQAQWLDKIVDDVLQLDNGWLSTNPDDTEKRKFMDKVFADVDKPTYIPMSVEDKNTLVLIDEQERNIISGTDYAYYNAKEDKTCLGKNYHNFGYDCEEFSEKGNIIRLEDKYNVFVDRQRKKGMRMYKIQIDVIVTFEYNVSFYIDEWEPIKGRKQPATIIESKTAFYHEKGHNKIVEYCFKKIHDCKQEDNNILEGCFEKKHKFPICVQMPFWESGEAWKWLSWAVSWDKKRETILRIVKRKIEERLNKINSDGKDSYYHKLYGSAGNYWDGYKER